MFSTTLARSLLRSNQPRAWLASVRPVSSFLGATTKDASYPAGISTTPTPPNQPIWNNIPQFQNHPSTPVFVGFAPPQPTTTTILLETNSVETLEMRKSNRNNRSSKKHKANHGKRPCNRQRRRSKKIAIGRRSRR